MASGTSDLFDKWFRLADVDRDGRISGQEAVTFFQRSGLGQDTLFRIWKIVAEDNSYLTKPQFWASLRLVSLAQRHGGQLPEAEAKRTLIGLEATPLPPPSLSGLESSTPSAESRASVGPRPFISDLQSPTQFPPLQAHTVQHYLQLFNQLDHDRDGLVQGGDCFGTFMHWGLQKQILGKIWQVVAGDSAALDQQQFVSCLYLMDLAKQNRPVPVQLPPGPFPPGYSSQAGLSSSLPASNNSSAVDLSSVQQVQHDVFANDLPTPTLPQRARFSPAASSAPTSSVPNINQQKLGELDALQQQRLQNERELAAQKETQAREAQEQAAVAAQKEKFFRDALQELTIFKSRMSASLLQAQEQLQSANIGATEMENTYQNAWTTAQANHTKSTALLEQLSEAKAKKAESRRKLEDLQKDINSLESITDEQVKAEQDPIPGLLQEVAKLEARKEELQLRQSTLFDTHSDLEERVSQLREDVDSASKSILSLEDGLDTLLKQLEGGDDSAALQLQSWLRKTASAHQTLLALAKKEKITVPELEDEDEQTSHVASNESIMWGNYIMIGAKDWDDDLALEIENVDELPSSTRLIDPTADAAPRKTLEEETIPEPAFPIKENGVTETESDSWAAF